MNLPVIAVALVAVFLWQLRRAGQGLSSILPGSGRTSASAGVDCETFQPPLWKRGVSQKWIQAKQGQTIGVVCGWTLVRVNPQTGKRIYGSSGGGGDVQSGQDPEYGDGDAWGDRWNDFWRNVLDGFTSGAGGGSLGS